MRKRKQRLVWLSYDVTWKLSVILKEHHPTAAGWAAEFSERWGCMHIYPVRKMHLYTKECSIHFFSLIEECSKYQCDNYIRFNERQQVWRHPLQMTCIYTCDDRVVSYLHNGRRGASQLTRSILLHSLFVGVQILKRKKDFGAYFGAKTLYEWDV